MEECKKQYIRICKQIGEPISHDAKGSIIWDIKANPKSDSLIKIYSEHSHEAELHTDSQYSSYPEDYFGLLTLIKAECGGGISILLSLKDVLEELQETEVGKKAEHIFTYHRFPIYRPQCF